MLPRAAVGSFNGGSAHQTRNSVSACSSPANMIWLDPRLQHATLCPDTAACKDIFRQSPHQWAAHVYKVSLAVLKRVCLYLLRHRLWCTSCTNHATKLRCMQYTHSALQQLTCVAAVGGRLEEPGHVHSLAAGQLLEQLFADGVQVSRTSACACCADLQARQHNPLKSDQHSLYKLTRQGTP